MKLKLAFLVNDIRTKDIIASYLDPFGIETTGVVAHKLHQVDSTLVSTSRKAKKKKKTPIKEIKQFLDDVLYDSLRADKPDYVIVTDADYYKAISGQNQAARNLGYVTPHPEGWHVIYAPNYLTRFFNPELFAFQTKLAMEAVIAHANMAYVPPGSSIIHSASYPTDPQDIETWLQVLLNDSHTLACDIETFTLKPHTAGIGTIAFAWSQHSGIAFPVDLSSDPTRVRNALRSFFIHWRIQNKKLLFHKISFDATVLIYQLFMEHPCDTKGLLKGLDILVPQNGNWSCTLLESYLATNSCAGNDLSLKTQAQEFAGNYSLGEDIKDITKVPLDKLLEYNLVDSLCTCFVLKKHSKILADENQLEIYENLLKPSTRDIVQMQLTGLPINIRKVRIAKQILLKEQLKALKTIETSPIVQSLTQTRIQQWVIAKNASYKKKVVTFADGVISPDTIFKPNSPAQLQQLLYEEMDLPILDRTKTGQPSTESDTLEALKHHTSDPEKLSLLDALLSYREVTILLSNFVPAMENAVSHNGWHYLTGNFTLGGTVSCRMSSNDPNLQNIPSTGTSYAGIIKQCFEAPPGWLLVGFDFDALENKIQGLKSGDPNILKTYIEGFDGHCLRAYAYYPDQLPGIDPDSAQSINAIDKLRPDLRQASKTPTYALQYGGTWLTLMRNCGFSQERAKEIEARYHELYAVSDAWTASELAQASRTGYVSLAFGLRLRTPLLAQVVRGDGLQRVTPHEAEREARTAGNALGQSYGLLNNRASAEFMSKVRASRYRHWIRPCAHIHDAQYHMIKDNVDVVEFYNNELVSACSWQDDPTIQHDVVKLTGKVSIYWPNWDHGHKLPNRASQEAILGIADTMRTAHLDAAGPS